MKFTWFLGGFLLLAACGSREGLKNVQWSKDQSGSGALSQLRRLDIVSKGTQDTKFESVEIAEQQLHGVPIESSFVKRIFDHDGELLAIHGAVETHPRYSPSKIAMMEQKKDSILRVVQDRSPELRKASFGTPRLVFIKEGKDLNLYWSLHYLDSKGEPWRLLVDSKDEVHAVERIGSDFQDFREITVKIFPAGPRHSVLQPVLLKDFVINGGLSSTRVSVTSLADVKIGTDSALNFAPSDQRFDEVQVFYFVNRALDWFQDTLGVNLRQSLDVEVHLGAPEKTNAAFYYQGHVRLGAGDDQTFSNIPEDPTIVVHETSHALIDQLAHLPFDGEGGSINEGFADFFAAVQLDDPNMGDSAYLKGPYRRTLENTDNLAQKDGGLYHDSSIVSGTLWDLKKKLGVEPATSIALKLLIQLDPTSDFADLQKKWPVVLTGLLKSPDLEAAQQILQARGWL